MGISVEIVVALCSRTRDRPMPEDEIPQVADKRRKKTVAGTRVKERTIAIEHGNGQILRSI